MTISRQYLNPNTTVAELATAFANGSITLEQAEFLSLARMNYLATQIGQALGMTAEAIQQSLSHVISHFHGTIGPFADQLTSKTWLGHEIDPALVDDTLFIGHIHGLPAPAALLINPAIQPYKSSELLKRFAQEKNALLNEAFGNLVNELPYSYPLSFNFADFNALSQNKQTQFIQTFINDHVNQLAPGAFSVSLKVNKNGYLVSPSMTYAANISIYADGTNALLQLQPSLATRPPLIDALSPAALEKMCTTLQAGMNSTVPTHLTVSPYTNINTLINPLTPFAQDITTRTTALLGQCKAPYTVKLNFAQSGLEPRAAAITRSGFQSFLRISCSNTTALSNTTAQYCALLEADQAAFKTLASTAQEKYPYNATPVSPLDQHFGRPTHQYDSDRFLYPTKYLFLNAFLFELLFTRLLQDYFANHRETILAGVKARYASSHPGIDARHLNTLCSEAFFYPDRLEMTPEEKRSYRITHALELIPNIMRKAVSFYALWSFTGYYAIGMNALVMLAPLLAGKYTPSLLTYCKNKYERVHHALSAFHHYIKNLTPACLAQLMSDIAQSKPVTVIDEFLKAQPEIKKQLDILISQEMFYAYLMLVMMPNVKAFTAAQKIKIAMAVIGGTSLANVTASAAHVGLNFFRRSRPAQLELAAPEQPSIAEEREEEKKVDQFNGIEIEIEMGNIFSEEKEENPAPFPPAIPQPSQGFMQKAATVVYSFFTCKRHAKKIPEHSNHQPSEEPHLSI